MTKEEIEKFFDWAKQNGHSDVLMSMTAVKILSDYLNIRTTSLKAEVESLQSQLAKAEADMREAFEFGLMNEFKTLEINDDNFRYFISLRNGNNK